MSRRYFVRNAPKMIITLVLLIILLYIAFFWSNTAVEKHLPQKYQEYVEAYSAEFGVDKNLVYAIIKAESDFRPGVSSHAGAMGLMQVMPPTATFIIKKLSLDLDASNIDLLDPETNIKIGTAYIKYLSGRFNGSPQLILAAYNGGEGNVEKWLTNPDYSLDGKVLTHIPYKETSNYVKKVSTYYSLYERLYG